MCGTSCPSNLFGLGETLTLHRVQIFAIVTTIFLSFLKYKWVFNHSIYWVHQNGWYVCQTEVAAKVIFFYHFNNTKVHSDFYITKLSEGYSINRKHIFCIPTSISWLAGRKETDWQIKHYKTSMLHIWTLIRPFLFWGRPIIPQ